jgi:probable HAF family extracellular repeat protein
MKRFLCGLVVLGVLVGGPVQADYIYTTFDVPGSMNETSALGINASGQIVGGYRGSDNLIHGFLLSGGSYTTFDVPGSTSTSGTGINNSGQIVGSYDANAGRHGFLLSGGTFTNIDVPGAIGTEAWGINASGQIVGRYNVPVHSGFAVFDLTGSVG